jgi:hypothetical protein
VALHELTGDSAPKADDNFGTTYLMAFIMIQHYATTIKVVHRIHELTEDEVPLVWPQCE